MNVHNMLTLLKDKNEQAYNETIEAINNAEFLYDTDNGGIYDPYEAEKICDDCEREFDILTDYFSGASKVAIIVDNIVFKTPYAGEVDWAEDDDYQELEEEAQTPYEWDGWTWRKIEYYDEDHPDYCDIEARVYQKAVEWGIENFFAETYHIPNTSVYVQKKYLRSIDDCSWTELTSLNEREAEEIIEEYNLIGFNIPFVIAAYWFENFSSQQLKTLARFLRVFDVNDLHSGNIAVFPDGSVRIIDYSGFCSKTGSLV